MNRWLLLHLKMCKFEDVSFFKEASVEEKFLLVQHGKINRKYVMVSYWYMLDAAIRIDVISIQIGRTWGM